MIYLPITIVIFNFQIKTKKCSDFGSGYRLCRHTNCDIYNFSVSNFNNLFYLLEISKILLQKTLSVVRRTYERYTNIFEKLGISISEKNVNFANFLASGSRSKQMTQTTLFFRR
jgi:hypothetical protein